MLTSQAPHTDHITFAKSEVQPLHTKKEPLNFHWCNKHFLSHFELVAKKTNGNALTNQKFDSMTEQVHSNIAIQA